MDVGNNNNYGLTMGQAFKNYWWLNLTPNHQCESLRGGPSKALEFLKAIWIILTCSPLHQLAQLVEA